MATRTLDIKDYCDSLYKELFDMKSRLGEFVTMIEKAEGREKNVLHPYIRHLDELMSFIDWKMEIFNKICPVDWSKFTKGVESTVSVPEVNPKETELTAGGYVGG